MSRTYARVSLTGDRSLSRYLERGAQLTSGGALREPLFDAASVYQRRVVGLLLERYKRVWVSKRTGRSKVYPQPKGRLERGVRRRMPRQQASGQVRLHIGWYYNWQDRQAASHVHLLERGTARRFTKRGLDRGRVEPMHFWRDAVRSSESTVTERMQRGVEEALKKL